MNSYMRIIHTAIFIRARIPMEITLTSEQTILKIIKVIILIKLYHFLYISNKYLLS